MAMKHVSAVGVGGAGGSRQVHTLSNGDAAIVTVVTQHHDAAVPSSSAASYVVHACLMDPNRNRGGAHRDVPPLLSGATLTALATSAYGTVAAMPIGGAVLTVAAAQSDRLMNDTFSAMDAPASVLVAGRGCASTLCFVPNKARLDCGAYPRVDEVLEGAMAVLLPCVSKRRLHVVLRTVYSAIQRFAGVSGAQGVVLTPDVAFTLEELSARAAYAAHLLLLAKRGNTVARLHGHDAPTPLDTPIARGGGAIVAAATPAPVETEQELFEVSALQAPDGTFTVAGNIPCRALADHVLGNVMALAYGNESVATGVIFTAHRMPAAATASVAAGAAPAPASAPGAAAGDADVDEVEEAGRDVVERDHNRLLPGQEDVAHGAMHVDVDGDDADDDDDADTWLDDDTAWAEAILTVGPLEPHDLGFTLLQSGVDEALQGALQARGIVTAEDWLRSQQPRDTDDAPAFTTEQVAVVNAILRPFVSSDVGTGPRVHVDLVRALNASPAPHGAAWMVLFGGLTARGAALVAGTLVAAIEVVTSITPVDNRSLEHTEHPNAAGLNTRRFVDLFAPCRLMVFAPRPPLTPASAADWEVQARRLQLGGGACPVCRRPYRYTMSTAHRREQPSRGLACVTRARVPVAFINACTHVACNQCVVKAALDLTTTTQDATVAVPGGTPFRGDHLQERDVGAGDALAPCPVCNLRMRCADMCALAVTATRAAQAWVARVLHNASPAQLADIDREIADADGLSAEDGDSSDGEGDDADSWHQGPAAATKRMLRYRRSAPHVTA